jgi:hypothetical protein
LWAGRNLYLNNAYKITATALRKYIYGIKAWHTFHNKRYPEVSEKRIDLLLKASAKIDAMMPKTPKKPPMMLKHLVYMAKDFMLGKKEENTIIDLAIVAFWGMARLGELTYRALEGKLEREFLILTGEVEIEYTPVGKKATLTIQNTKTASPGVTQQIQLFSMKSMLCPVKAVE